MTQVGLQFKILLPQVICLDHRYASSELPAFLCRRAFKSGPQIPQEGVKFRVYARIGGTHTYTCPSMYVVGGNIFVCLVCLSGHRACRRGVSLLTSTGVARETSAATARAEQDSADTWASTLINRPGRPTSVHRCIRPLVSMTCILTGYCMTIRSPHSCPSPSCRPAPCPMLHIAVLQGHEPCVHWQREGNPRGIP